MKGIVHKVLMVGALLLISSVANATSTDTAKINLRAALNPYRYAYTINQPRDLLNKIPILRYINKIPTQFDLFNHTIIPRQHEISIVKHPIRLTDYLNLKYSLYMNDSFTSKADIIIIARF